MMANLIDMNRMISETSKRSLSEITPFINFAAETFGGIGACDDCSRYIVYIIKNIESNIIIAAQSVNGISQLYLSYHFLYFDENEKLRRYPNEGHESLYLEFTNITSKKFDIHLSDDEIDDLLYLIKTTMNNNSYVRVEIYDADENYDKNNHVFVLTCDCIIDTYAFKRACEIRPFDWIMFREYLKTKNNFYWNKLFNIEESSKEIVNLCIDITI